MISIMSEWLESANCIVMYTMVVTVGYDSSCLFSVFIVKKNVNLKVYVLRLIYSILCALFWVLWYLYFFQLLCKFLKLWK